MPEPSATGTANVDATPEQVYDLLSDVRTLSELADETERCTLLGGVRTTAVGVRFRGVNRRGIRRWSTVSTVTDAERGKRFAFEVSSLGFIPVARWRYDITPQDQGCVVTESTWDRRPKWFVGFTRIATGVADRAAVNRENIAGTLSRLKTRAETPS